MTVLANEQVETVGDGDQEQLLNVKNLPNGFLKSPIIQKNF